VSGEGFAPLLDVLDRVEGLDARLGGGWGIDVLAGRVTREHHDVDLLFPIEELLVAASHFTVAGFGIVDEDPSCRIVVQSGSGERVDLNGLKYGADGHAVQADREGDVEIFPGWGWTERTVDGRPVTCLTAEAQRFKHRGYPPRAIDGADLAAIAHIDEPPRFDATVRTAGPNDIALVDGIETASDRLLEPLGYWPLPTSGPAALAAQKARAAVTLVAGRPAVGFVRLENVDGHAHIGQLSVVPEYGRLGLGRALVDAGCAWARERGDRIVTLTTFAGVPFNAPWYRRLGFEELNHPPGPELRGVVAEERDLEELGDRVVMGRRLE
jgi:ribosomal protein S18 acetylase RimI-like enzyme